MRASAHEGGKTVRLNITNDGAGFGTEKICQVEAEDGFGLFRIRERMSSCGGRIAMEFQNRNRKMT